MNLNGIYNIFMESAISCRFNEDLEDSIQCLRFQYVFDSIKIPQIPRNCRCHENHVDL